MFRLLTTAVLLFPLIGSASAQCLGPDGLGGDCWTPTPANLPNLPGLSLPGTGICWQNCTPQPQFGTNVVINPPVQTACGRYVANLAVSDNFGNPIVGGNLILDYTRTWEEHTAAAPPDTLQVYRFVVKIDMQQTGAATACGTPTCLGAFGTAFYYGFLDYAFNCNTGGVQGSLMLYHGCDRFQHRPGLSSRPGVFHPNRSYAIVAPHTAANPFVAANLSPPIGAMLAEAVRNVPNFAGQPCLTEDRIAAGQIDFIADGCACPLAAAPVQLTARRMLGAGQCADPVVGATVFLTLNTLPALPWRDLMTTSIGEWTTNLSYPGAEAVWADEGPFLYRDSCAGDAGPALFAELQYGATTKGGFEVIPEPFNPLTNSFTDLASNAAFPIPGAIPLPLVGNVERSRHLIYVNVD